MSCINQPYLTRDNTRRLFLQTLSGLALAPTVVASRAAQPPLLSPPGMARGLPNPVVLTHTGRTVRFVDDLLADKIVVVNMMYASCVDICPPNTAALVQVQQALGERLGRDVAMVSITLRPEFDRPDDLAAYAKKFGVRAGWEFITGRSAEIDAIRRALGFSDPDPAVDADILRHTTMVRIGNVATNRWAMMPVQATVDRYRQLLYRIS